MKIIKRLLSALLIMPATAIAHPGHEHEGLSSANHILSVAEPYLLFLAVVVFMASAALLVKRN